MRDWWDGLQPRERLMLGGGAVVLALLAVYLLLFEPVTKRQAALASSVAAKRAELAWMQDQAKTVVALRRTGQTLRSEDRRSLLAVVDSSLIRAKLKPQLQRMEPDGNDAVKLWFGATNFDDLMLWLDALDQQSGLQVASLRLKPIDQPALVDANLTLKRELP